MEWKQVHTTTAHQLVAPQKYTFFINVIFLESNTINMPTNKKWPLMQQFHSKSCLPAVMRKQCYSLLGCSAYSSTFKKEAMHVL
jgi:hypothetical protein